MLAKNINTNINVDKVFNSLSLGFCRLKYESYAHNSLLIHRQDKGGKEKVFKTI